MRDNFVRFASEHMPGYLTWLGKDQCSSVRVAEECSFFHWEHPELPLHGKAPAVPAITELLLGALKLYQLVPKLSLSSVCFKNMNLTQHWLMAAYSSSQMGLTAPPGTSRALQGRLSRGRCCLGEDLAQACAESMCFSGSLYGQNNSSGQRVIYNCPPTAGFLREDVGMGTAIPCTHTATHTTAVCRTT